jgi:hypothetical protein
MKMFFRTAEHNPPHVHAEYAGQWAEYDIQSGERIKGFLPRTAEYLIKLWIELHKEELLKIWETQEFTKIAPLE